ncbi:CNNM domain-containing protein [Marinomonas sp. GJ51-6]|uniref:CNNM domain-containing protein n=1 Tax=Marinomonas sp. GJ51-6 TaxID=2992802 RepID=UPI002934AA58|nr:CNNM domain-containing protein [Marinomonas sp. GJ51-6]WOD06337.1 CNNM domain-containing protein [Marinomonas sp. GJ51-6]
MNDMLSIGLLIIAGALFAMSEIGMAAARKIKLRVLAEEGDLKAQAVINLQQKPGPFLR